MPWNTALETALGGDTFEGFQPGRAYTEMCVLKGSTESCCKEAGAAEAAGWKTSDGVVMVHVTDTGT